MKMFFYNTLGLSELATATCGSLVKGTLVEIIEIALEFQG